MVGNALRQRFQRREIMSLAHGIGDQRVQLGFGHQIDRAAEADVFDQDAFAARFAQGWPHRFRAFDLRHAVGQPLLQALLFGK